MSIDSPAAIVSMLGGRGIELRKLSPPAKYGK